MGVISRPVRAGTVAVMGLAITAFTGTLASALFFHDVTGAGHIAKNNGLFPAVPGFDLATGIGTIKMAPFIIGSF